MYPSATKFEAEIVAMALDLLNGPKAGSDACGVVTGGGSESLISALYAYREAARTERGVTRPKRSAADHGPCGAGQGCALDEYRGPALPAAGGLPGGCSQR